jgi:exodeoxyribonuclease VII small subunit
LSKAGDKRSYRTIKGELDEVMRNLQSEELDVDEAIELFNKGHLLLKELEDYLNSAENTVKQIKAKFE